MSVIFFLLFLCIVLALVFLGCGLGVGVALHWLFPAIDWATGTVIGVLAVGFAARTVQSLFAQLPAALDEEASAGGEGQLERVFHLVETPEYGRRRKRRTPRQ